MTPPPTEAIYTAPRPAALRDRECDFCGRHVQQTVSIQQTGTAADTSEVVALCPECALGAD